MAIRVFIVAFVAYLLSGCTDALDKDVEALVTAKNLWISKASGKDYEYTISFDECFCKLRGLDIKVFVSDGSVIAANPVSRQAIEEPIYLKQFWTIKEHYEHLFSELKERAEGNGRIVYEVSYDQMLGYPTAVYLDRRGIMDANVQFTISNVRIKS